MREDILSQLEQKVADAISHIDLLLKRIHFLQEENVQLKAEQAARREELKALLQRFDHINLKTPQPIVEAELDLVDF